MARPAPPVPPKLAKEAVSLAMQLHRRKLWTEFGEHDAFAVRLAGEPHPWFVSIMGSGGQQFGFACYSGLVGLSELREIVFVGGEDRRTFRSEIVVVTVDPQRAIPGYLRDVYRAAGHEEPLAPSFMRIGPDSEPRSARKPELRRVCTIMRGLLLAHDRGLLRPSPLARSGKSRLLTLTIEGIELRARFEDFFAAPDEVLSGVATPPGLADLPRTAARWSVGFRISPVQVADEPKAVFALLVYEAVRDRILALKMIGGDDVEAATTLLLNLMQIGGSQSEPGLPQAVAFASRRLHDAVAPLLAEVGVESRFEPEQPELERVFDKLARELGDRPGADDDAPPADHAQRALLTRVAREIHARGLLSRRRREDFFGTGDEPTAEPEFATAALLEWLLVDYRPSPRHRTLAEKLLASRLPDDERAVLQARVDAPPSAHRIDAIDADRVTLSDLFADRKVQIEDPGLAAAVPVGTILVGRVCGAGGDGFLALLAPPFPDLAADRAFAFLESLGMELSAAGIARAPHLLGRLFRWSEQRSSTPPQMQNTDGEPLRMQNASFVCADPRAVPDELDARDDVEFDDDSGAWIWFREETRERRTLLGRIQPIGDRLVLEVNSDGRLARARAWLERIPGVRFERATELDADAAHPSRSAPASAVDLTPELVEHVQELIRARYLDWVDEPIPALGGKTPREAVRTADGRRRVELLIKTIPDPGGIPGVKAPRDEIRRELGLGPAAGLERGEP